MPFGIKNVGYKRLMDKVFVKQIKQNVKVYMNDILAKSLLSTNLVSDLEETFVIIRRYGMKLNLEKCIFKVRRGRFLRYMMTEWGIESNPKKVEAI